MNISEYQKMRQSRNLNNNNGYDFGSNSNRNLSNNVNLSPNNVGYDFRNNVPKGNSNTAINRAGSTTARVNTVVAGIGGAVLGSALGKLFNKFTGEKSSNMLQVAGNNAQIDLPGTLMGSLANVVNTRQYMQNFARYNNYLTSNLGLAQMASDRYMSLKERIPMSLEYYQTPTEKKKLSCILTLKIYL